MNNYHFDDKKHVHTLDGRKYITWKCHCGKEMTKRLDHMQRPNSRWHCGCRSYSKSLARPYRIWQGMIKRCEDKNNQAYHRYGGRGIKVSEDWHHFEIFWFDMSDTYSSKLTLDRINNDGDYCRENCRWATYHQQARNMRSNVLIEHDGKTMIAADWCKELGRSYQAVRQRVYEGKTYKQALHLES